MLRQVLATIAVLLALICLYFLLWPVPVDPVAWQAPVDRGFIDPFSPNNRLESATGIGLGDYRGPEDATLGTDGRIYVTTENGSIIHIQGRRVSKFADAGGRPLGIEVARDGSFFVANAVLGLQHLDMNGDLQVVLDAIDGEPLHNANNLAIGPDGIIYFSQSSTKFTASGYGGSYEASLLDLLEHGGHGNVYAFDPGNGAVSRLMTGLNYANGVAISDDGAYLIVAEMGHYRILKYWLSGELQGTTQVLIDNLPAFPDNVKSGMNDRFWIGFAAPRNKLLDDLSDNPFLRKVVQRLPADLRPKATAFSHVIAIDGEGAVLMSLHDQAARFPTLTGVLETRDSLYLTTLFGQQLPRLNKSDL